MLEQQTDQRMDALQQANARRSAMVEIKNDLKSKSHDEAIIAAVGLLLAPPDDLRTMKLRQFLGCLPRVGVGTSTMLMRSVGIGHGDLRVGPSSNGHHHQFLTERQRRELALLLRRRVRGMRMGDL